MLASLPLIATLCLAADSADDLHRQAGAAFRRAQASYERRDFATAALGFEEAFRFEPHPSPLLNAADAWERASELGRAAEDCDRVVALEGAEERFKKDAELRLSRLTNHVARLRVDGPRGVLVQIDGGEGAPVPFTRRLPPGSHRLVIVARRGEWTQELSLIAGSERELDVTERARSLEEPAPVLLPRAEPPPPRAASRATQIAVGVSAAAAATGTVLGVLTLNAQGAYNANPTYRTRDAFYGARLASNASWATAAAGLAATALFWWRAGPPISATIFGGGGNAVLTFSGRWP